MINIGDDVVVGGEIGIVHDYIGAVTVAIRLDSGQNIAANVTMSDNVLPIPDIFSALTLAELDCLEFVLNFAVCDTEAFSCHTGLLTEIKGISDSVTDVIAYENNYDEIRAANINSGDLDDICDCLTHDFPIND